MRNRFNINEEEKNRIRGLHLTESQDLRFTSVLNEAGTPLPTLERCFTVNFESGGSEISKTEFTDAGVIMNQIYQGMLSDRPFIDIEVGVSGPGSVEDNEVVMGERVNAALDYLIGKMAGIKGPTGLAYSVEALKNKATINKVYGTEEAGSISTTGERIPTDSTDEYFEKSQYVTICFNRAGETPEYVNLADRFVKATTESIAHTDIEEVYDILESLRDGEDFDNFNNYLTQIGQRKDFYEIACERAKIPGAEGKTSIFGWEVDIVPDEVGPPELGGGDRTINVILKNLGVEPIDC